MACHVSTCMALCHAYIRGSHGLLVEARESSRSVRGSSKEKRKGGKEKEEERKIEREERKGRREERKGERKEEKRRKKGRKRGKRKRKRKECCAVSSPGWQRTRNYATRGRFPPTLVILRLGAM